MSDMPEVRSVLSQQHPRSAAHESAGEQWLPICLALTWTQETMGDPCPDAFEAGREWEPSCRTAEQIAAPWQVPSSKLYFGIELPDCEAGFWDHRREREHTHTQTITNNHKHTGKPMKKQQTTSKLGKFRTFECGQCGLFLWFDSCFFASKQAASTTARQMKAVLIRAIQGAQKDARKRPLNGCDRDI